MTRTMAALVLCGALAACATAPDGATRRRPAADFASVRTGVEADLAEHRYPGAAFAIARRDKVLDIEAVGLADTQTRSPVRIDSIFQQMSMTKPVTAVAVMILVQDGKLDLDAPVSKVLPEFQGFGPAGAPPLTLRHLLTHTSGIGFGSLPFAPSTLEQRVHATAMAKRTVPAGSAWAYSGVEGADVAARVVEVVAGEPYDAFVRRKIFSPLGMKDTGYSLNVEQKGRLVGLYEAKASALTPAKPMFPPLTYPSGGAGLYSTVGDYLRLAQMLANDGALDGVRILKPASVAEIRRAQIPAGFPGLSPGLDYGLMVRRIGDPVAAGSPLPAGAYGWSGAYGTHFWVDPTTGLAAVWMISLSNAGGAGSPDALTFEKRVTQACQRNRRCGQ
ncbi:serine hydrolase domain-containing protein [Caulobacter rhizosphaerae]|uniref:serine hydrolase domain-containing protein n=2 Tax=Caulobacter rhizosphaerae TaxID=2010972 RepID=UPI0013D6493A|nr:serine hydrolase domain-containing protein [Caulobacter rhizosphaerae]